MSQNYPRHIQDILRYSLGYPILELFFFFIYFFSLEHLNIYIYYLILSKEKVKKFIQNEQLLSLKYITEY